MSLARQAREDQDTELRSARICDANLAAVQADDADARRIFTATFTDAVTSRRVRARLTAEIQTYAKAKAATGRLDLYDRIFAGI